MITSRKPLTWGQFIESAKKQNGGALCQCGEETCSVQFPPGCPRCGRPLTVAIHVNAPTLIIGCTPCGESFAYLQLVP